MSLKQYLELIRPWFFLSVWLFTMAVAIGGLIGCLTDSILSQGATKTQFGVLPIFYNNLTINIIAIMGGLFVGLIPTAILIVNGSMIGYTLSAAFVHTSVSPLKLFYAIAPHALPELFSLFFSCTLGYRTWKIISTKKLERKEFFFFAVSILIITAATYIAAYIEVNISYTLAKSFTVK